MIVGATKNMSTREKMRVPRDRSWGSDGAMALESVSEYETKMSMVIFSFFF